MLLSIDGNWQHGKISGEIMTATMSKGGSSNKRSRENDDAEVAVGDDNPPSTLSEIQERIKQLIDRIPSKEETARLSVDDIPALERWCKTVRKITRDYNLSLNFVAIANYQWEPDRPGKLSHKTRGERRLLCALMSLTTIANSICLQLRRSHWSELGCTQKPNTA